MKTPQQSAVDEVITSRYSCRAFLPDPVPRETIAEILEVAARAPSGTNIQPWKVWVLTGATKTRLSERLLAAFDDPEEAATHSDPWQYYPKQWVSPYIDRRRKVGMQLYGLLGIQKGDAKRMHEQFARNYKFFDAPVGLIFTVDRVMEQGSWLDYGMFLENVMLAAKARGLDTCPQAALIQFHRLIRPGGGDSGQRDADLRHVARPCRPGRAGERAPHRARRAGGVGRLPRLSLAPATWPGRAQACGEPSTCGRCWRSQVAAARAASCSSSRASSVAGSTSQWCLPFMSG